MVTEVVTEKGKRPARLSHTFVKNVARPGRYGDGRGSNGLTLLVKPTTNGRWSKTWSQRLRVNGRSITMGLGSFPVVSLAAARERALDNAQRVAGGVDPRVPPRVAPTLAEAFEQVIAERRSGWSYAEAPAMWRRSLGHCGRLSESLVSEVTASDVVDVLRPFWRDRQATANRILSHLSTVMKWAMLHEYRVSNPAVSATVQSLGAAKPVGHQPSLDYSVVGSALAEIRDCDSRWELRYASIFLALTVVRTDNVCGAVWEDIDRKAGIWRIPASAMKGPKDKKEAHEAPLANQAVMVLDCVAELTGRVSGLVFSAKGKKLERSSLPALFKRRNIDAVPHGFRASFSGWAGSGLAGVVPERYIDAALAHKPRGLVDQAYKRDKYFLERTPLMQGWADYVSETMGPVISEADVHFLALSVPSARPPAHGSALSRRRARAVP